MKWKTWGTDHWVLVADDDEVLDNIKRNPFNDLFTVLSNNKNYTSLKAAQEAELKRRMITAKEKQDDR